MGGANRRVLTGGRQGARTTANTIPPALQQRFADLGNSNLVMPATKLFITLFRTQFVDNLPMQDFFAAAERVLKPHGFELDALPADKNPFVIDYNGGPINTELDASDLRQSASRKFTDNGNPPRLPIIFCKFNKAFEGEAVGVTFVNTRNPPDGVKTMADGSNWLPFCCVDGAPGAAFATTMVHEIGHAALLEHENADTNTEDVMHVHKPDEKQNPRSKFNGLEVRALAGAYFARPRVAVPYKLQLP